MNMSEIGHFRPNRTAWNRTFHKKLKVTHHNSSNMKIYYWVNKSLSQLN